MINTAWFCKGGKLFNWLRYW